MALKILYINSPQNDFLSDSFLIGLKELFPTEVYEYPINNHIYKKEVADGTKLHGIGFTLYQLFEPNQAKAYTEDMNFASFDLFIFGDIYRQSSVYKKLQPYLSFSNTLILDGEDTPAPFPFYFSPWKKPYSLFFPKLVKKHVYFKREIIPRRTNYYLKYKLVPKSWAAKLKLPTNLKPISFSIPRRKICDSVPVKTKLFGKHVVDESLLPHIPGAMSKYAFTNEADYYNDLQQSKFGITTKRGGWDCLRHYEIAANRTVICFKQLHLKPEVCAPHGLIAGVNCIDYEDYTDLMAQINQITDAAYQILQENSLKWVVSKSSANYVQEIVSQFGELTQNSSIKSK